MDYKIKFEYKDAGKSLGAQRKQLGNLAKSQKAGTTSGVPSKDSGLSTQKMTDSVKKLIDSNKKLEKSLDKTSRSVSKSSGRGGGGGGAGGGDTTGRGMGSVGSSLPYVGALFALAGFAISKINQVADSYLALAGQQKGSVGLSGMVTQGQGMFSASEIGAGRKSYVQRSGKFGNKISSGAQTAAVQMGNIFGISPDESMGQAGVFARAGGKGSYEKSLYAGAGAGIETDLPAFMSAISNELEEAVKNGVNASSMSEDLGKEFASLTMRTQNKSTDTALRAVQAFSSVKKQVEGGTVGGYENVMAWQAGQNIVKEQFADADKKTAYVDKLKKAGIISESEAEKLSGLKTGAGMKDIQDVVGIGGTKVLTERAISETGSAEMLRRTMLKQQDTFGTGERAKRSAWNVYSNQGGQMTQEQYFAAFDNARDGVIEGSGRTGKGIIAGKSASAMDTAAGFSSTRQNTRESFQLNQKAAKDMVKASWEIEKQMMGIAEKAIDLSYEAAKGMKVASEKAGEFFTGANSPEFFFQSIAEDAAAFKGWIQDMGDTMKEFKQKVTDPVGTLKGYFSE